MATIRGEYSFSDLPSVKCKATLVMTHTDAVAFRDWLASKADIDIAHQVGKVFDRMVGLAESNWGTGEVHVPAPDPPDAVGMEVVGGGIRVFWEEVVGADGYIVKLGVKESKLKDFKADSTEFTKENLPRGRTYYARVACVKDGIEGDASVVQSLYLPFLKPDAPSLIGSYESGVIVLDWGVIDGAEDYVVYCNGEVEMTTPGTRWEWANPDVGTHTFTVTAKNLDAESDPSEAYVVEVV